MLHVLWLNIYETLSFSVLILSTCAARAVINETLCLIKNLSTRATRAMKIDNGTLCSSLSSILVLHVLC